jgi:hypothetical protein
VPTRRYSSASTPSATSSENRWKISGAAATATTVSAVSASTATLNTALVASSSSSSAWRLNIGTSEADSTPPSSNS